ncbi:serine hydrolase [Virgisporangium aliadipatigenens]|uniref:Serine hydrolase n=1 Tax=Virgisporangium aliadipatigenens TaxID=741659 RepID=A0A8J4DPL0_9ACTN|nr:serine hydrolase domain-containing protein [Virgisporangium aliadipatigenens]GIJ46060.1 serine hydrolase [Virgisporangium aliadipatigenens]
MKSVLLLMLTLAVAPAPPDTLQRDVDALRATGVSGVLARLETPAGVRVARSGVADLETGRPLPPDPYLRIGSTTKAFVAVVVLQLAGEGRLSLDDPVERHLPGVVSGNGNDGGTVTVAQLLQHTSGLYDYSADLVHDYVTPGSYRANRWRTYTPRQLVAVAMGHPPAARTWSYSNTNYVLAGMLIRAVTGRDWTHEVHTRILEPLGLRHTRTPGTWPYLPAPSARNYQVFAPGAEPVDTTIAVRGLDSGADGSMISTATDMNRFFAALVGGRLLEPAQWERMRTLVPVPDGHGLPPGSGDGLGVFHVPLSCGGGYWRHGGNGFGYQFEPAVTDDGRRRLTLSVFSRTFDRPVSEARDEAVRELIDRALCT